MNLHDERGNTNLEGKQDCTKQERRKLVLSIFFQ